MSIFTFNPTDRVFMATVIEVLADAGGAVVLPNGSPVNDQNALIVATLPYNDAALGAAVYPMYSAGSTVLCCKPSGKCSDIVYIVGSINIALDPRIDGFLSHKLYNVEDIAQADKMFSADWALLEKLCPNRKHTWLRDRSHGVSGDAIAGDLDILDKTGYNGLHIGRLMSQLKGSALSFVDISLTDNAIRLVGDSVAQHTLLHETMIADSYKVSNTAISSSEAFGVRSGGCVRETDKGLQLVEDTAIPLYRIQHMEGAVVDGVEDNILGFSKDADVSRHDADNEPPVLAKRRQALSGELTDASAYGILSVKSPFISAAMQLGYGKKPAEGGDNAVFDDLREPFSEASPQAGESTPVDVDRKVTDAALNKLIDTLLAGDYKDALLKIMASRGFSISSKDASVLPKAASDKTIGGVCDGSEYPLPDTITLKDPVTGAEKTYFASMSFISQEPDGSICLCDGYGSEIRMSRGNIYISPALDCFIRPGRDMSVMAARHQSYNSQETCSINTAEAMFIRAEKDMKIGGATGGDGIVILESGNTAVSKDKGLVIRSLSDASFTVSSGMYIGRNRHVLTNDTTLDANATAGTIVIDAGAKGALYTKGSSMTMDTGVFVACANNATWQDGGTGCAIIMTPTYMYLNTPSVVVPGNLTLARPGTHDYVYVERGGKSVHVDTGAQGSNFGIQADGDLFITGNMKINGQGIFTSGVYSTTVCGIGEYRNIEKAPKESRADIEKKRLFEYPDGVVVKPADTLKGIAGSAYQNYYVTENAFKFPYTYNVNCPIMPGMVWQENSKQQGNIMGDAWNEPYIRDTACYPGIDVWSRQVISTRGYHTNTPVQDGYRTNTRHIRTEAMS